MLFSYSTWLFCICALLLLLCCTATHLDTRSSVLETSDVYIQETENSLEKGGENQEEVVLQKQRNWLKPMRVSSRRHLNGLGSYPPRCKSKCGKCTPCKPVHVPVPPGTSEPTEYYPEAWRCKCGNKLYMP
ncbi:Epidermal patterning factor-like protein [Thalictrum thalictroides]|uniref:Epidermal patterning factor-like protein n=1 Tax=Thalictrum thalictroides TaxID=46969 RepID=A0A7J6X7F5_THATH|nr:Epidermal patterning factor-like protein [Thalictrum thalictroides]